MKLIIAVVRPHVLDRLIVAFEDIEGFPGITVTDSEGFGQRIRTPQDVLDPFRHNKRIEIVASDEIVEMIVAAIKQHAHTGKKGDGVVAVVTVEEMTLI